GALHGAPEGDAPLQLLRDGLGDQLGVDLGLADLDDVEMRLALRHVGDLAAQPLDVRALLADHNARPRRVNRDARLLGRPLDDDAADPGLRKLLLQPVADLDVLVQQLGVLAAVREPARIPSPVDAEPEPDRVDLLAHQAASSRSRTTIRNLLNGFSIRPIRPRPRACQRFITNDFPTVASRT